jgi:hypothetical protein
MVYCSQRKYSIWLKLDIGDNDDEKCPVLCLLNFHRPSKKSVSFWVNITYISLVFVVSPISFFNNICSLRAIVTFTLPLIWL